MKLINRVHFANINKYYTQNGLGTHANKNVNVMSVGCLLVAALWLVAFI